MAIVLVACVLGYVLVAQRLSSSPITAPIVFIGLGLLMSLAPPLDQGTGTEALYLLAEIALIILLFIDAAQIDVPTLLHHHQWSRRILLIGMPLAMLMGAGVHWLIVPEFGWPVALLIGALLVPTDAALGQPVISNTAIPPRPRRALSVESGLNDGIALPAVLITAALVAPGTEDPPFGWTVFAASQVILGPLVGMAGGWIGGTLFIKAKENGYSAPAYEGIGALALAILLYLAAGAVGGNGFIAAFAGGLLFNSVVGDRCRFVYEFTDSEGQLLSWGAFLLIATYLLPAALAEITPSMLAIILLSLFVVRPIAIYLSLIGTDASPVTRLFFGWFGPRGLATAVFALIVTDLVARDVSDWLLALAVNTVFISAVLHGLSAAPLGRWYAAYLSRRPDCPEQTTKPQTAKPLPTERSG